MGIELTAVITFTRLYSCHCNNSLKKVEASWKRSRIAYECKRDGCGLILNSRKLTIFSSSLWHHKLLALSFVIFQPYLDFVWLNVPILATIIYEYILVLFQIRSASLCILYTARKLKKSSVKKLRFSAGFWMHCVLIGGILLHVLPWHQSEEMEI